MNQREIDLVLQAQKGSLASFEKLWNLYCQEVYQQVCLTIRNAKDAKNVLQLTYIIAGQNLNKLKQPDAFRVWIHWVARRQCRQYAENHGYSFEDSEDALPYVSVSQQNSELYIPVDYIEDTELVKVFGKIVASLSDVQRESLALSYMAQMDLDETAGVLETSISDMKTILFMARCEIRDAILKFEDEQGIHLYGSEDIHTISLTEALPIVGESMSLPESTASAILSNVIQILKGEDEEGEKEIRSKKIKDRKKNNRNKVNWKEFFTLPEDPVKRTRVLIGMIAAASALIVLILLVTVVKSCSGHSPSESFVEESSKEESSQEESSKEEIDPSKITESEAQTFFSNVIAKLDNELAYDGVLKYARKFTNGNSVPDYYQIRCLEEAYFRITGEKLQMARTVEENGFPMDVTDSEKQVVLKKAEALNHDYGYAYCSLQDLQTILDYFYGAGTVRTADWIKKTDSSSSQLPYVTPTGYLFYDINIDIMPEDGLYYSLYSVAVDGANPYITVKALRRENYYALKDAASGHAYYKFEPDPDVENRPSDSEMYYYYLQNGNEGNIFTTVSNRYAINDYFLNTIEIHLTKNAKGIFISEVDYPERGDYVVNTPALRVRSIPSTEGEILGIVNEGEYLTILTKESDGDDGTWGRIMFLGMEGYVSMDYLDKWSAGLEQEEESNRLSRVLEAAKRRERAIESGDLPEESSRDEIGELPEDSQNPESSMYENSSESPSESYGDSSSVSYGEGTYSQPGTYIVNSSIGLNVRSDPSTDYDPIAILDDGMMVEVLEVLGTPTEEWGRIVLGDGTTGYVYMLYLKLS